MATVLVVASERPTTEDAVTTDKTTFRKHEEAAMALAYHVNHDMQFTGKLTQLSLDALEIYRATQAEWYAEIDARIAASKEAA